MISVAYGAKPDIMIVELDSERDQKAMIIHQYGYSLIARPPLLDLASFDPSAAILLASF